jgi:hypothetical protein
MNDSSWLALLFFPAVALVIAGAIVWWTLPRSKNSKRAPGDKSGDDSDRSV